MIHDGDAHFKTFLVGEYFQVMKTNFFNINVELKSTRSSWKRKLILEVVSECDNDGKKY